MTYCLNPQCNERQNPDDAKFCLSCGQTLLLRGRFRALRALGRGGFGRTYLGVDRDRLDTPCAIKQFLPAAKSAPALKKSVQLFSQEALRLRELGEHPQIPALVAYFQEAGCLYLVQEFVAGPNLAQEFQRQGPFCEAQIIALLRDLLSVLQFVHDRQTIHRDLKPANLIRRKRDGRLVVIDFGVAKNLAAETNGQPGTRIGTEGYSPAEQLRGGHAYPASDLYSVGAICVFLLTGVHPEELYNPMTGRWPWREQLAQWGDRRDLDESAPTVIADEATQAALAAVTAARNGQRSMPDYKLPAVDRVSEGLGRLIDKLLEENVSDRYHSASAVLADLDRLTAASTHLPVSPFWRADLPTLTERDRRKRCHGPAISLPPPVIPPPKPPLVSSLNLMGEGGGASLVEQQRTAR